MVGNGGKTCRISYEWWEMVGRLVGLPMNGGKWWEAFK